MRLYFSQLMLDREESVASHPGYQAAEMKEVGDDIDPLVGFDRVIGWLVDGAAAAKDAARAESRTEPSMSLEKRRGGRKGRVGCESNSLGLKYSRDHQGQ
jgi:hypothetical protein